MTTALIDNYLESSLLELEYLYQEVSSKVQLIRASGIEVYPDSNLELACLYNFGDFRNVKVVIVGQDPYINPGQAHGLAFSVPPGTILPPSLQNIFKELKDDLKIPISDHGCLSNWVSQGVLLLNRTLTVQRGRSGSHHDLGWEVFTNKVIEIIDRVSSSTVYMLWGNKAQEVEKTLTNPYNLVLKAPHPSPFSAHRGFFGCKHFSKANRFLLKNEKTPIDWSI